MLKILHELASCEDHSQTYITETAVFRRIDEEHSRVVKSILAQLKEFKIDGIVDTKIVCDKMTLDFFDVNARAILLEHKLVEFISYPHEWCSMMLMDAAIFHVELSKKLSKIGLYLKDAHAWNILFENGRPVFIDFSSIVTERLMLNEKFLQELDKDSMAPPGEERDFSLVKFQQVILDVMFLPYFFIPILGYAYGNRNRIRKCIELTTLNAATSTISIRDTFPSLRGLSIRGQLKGLKNIWLIVRNIQQFRRMRKMLTISKKPAEHFNKILKFLNQINVEIGETPYSDYYKNKGEDVSWIYSDQWNEKQKTIYEILNRPDIHTVVDVACNTGWYAILAERLGKKVIAFDIDEGCIEFLYKSVKKEGLNILPLVMDFTNLTRSRYSILDGKEVLIDAVARFKSDLVIALGIIHHLFLGMGMSFEEIIKKLSSLSKSQLVIEFVDPSDLMIKNEPSFFPAYFKNELLIAKYNLDNLLFEIKKCGYKVEIKKSYPETRVLLECTKCEPVNSF